MAAKEEKTKEEKIKSEIRRLNKALKDLDKNKQTVVKKLIESAAFTAVSLEELQKVINENGFVTTYQNGENQFGTKQSDEVKTFIALQKNLTTILKNLAEIAPPTAQKGSRLEALRGE